MCGGKVDKIDTGNDQYQDTNQAEHLYIFEKTRSLFTVLIISIKMYVLQWLQYYFRICRIDVARFGFLNVFDPGFNLVLGHVLFQLYKNIVRVIGETTVPITFHIGINRFNITERKYILKLQG